ncbi:restriction endonuclease subunit S [Polaromonas hydrogenivorans]|uniref:Restriction endonuclease subunit S n=1 Tax=Polaromonas hydrogenivorans TaxID=335476 RepID=A0AAU7LX01_9BURK
MSFPRYPNYKDSGVEWLEEVPEHWAVQPVKSLTTRIASGKTPLGGSETYVDEGVTFLRSQNVYDEGLHLDDVAFISNVVDESMAVSRVQPGDILLNITGASIGRSCVVPVEFPPANVNQHVCVIRALKTSQVPFLSWTFKSTPVKSQIAHVQNGAAREGLNFDQIGRMLVAIPPMLEQFAIAAFLDRETAKIDGLVAEQRRLMDLLREKRQAVISHAVTQGLNPHAPMKPSGIEGIANVPAHWDVLVIKRFSTLHRGHDLTDAERTDGSYPVVTSSGINGTHGSFMAHGPGVVTGRYGSTGRLFYIQDDFWPHNTSLYVSNFHCNHPRFVWYSLQTVDFAAHSAKAAVPGIDRNDIHVLPVAVPPKDEQGTIVTFLDSELAKLDTLTAEAQRGIDLLQERRTALISAAVTGQIDVRGCTPC